VRRTFEGILYAYHSQADATFKCVCCPNHDRHIFGSEIRGVQQEPSRYTNHDGSPAKPAEDILDWLADEVSYAVRHAGLEGRRVRVTLELLPDENAPALGGPASTQIAPAGDRGGASL
jgi:hypothetical protein